MHFLVYIYNYRDGGIRIRLYRDILFLVSSVFVFLARGLEIRHVTGKRFTDAPCASTSLRLLVAVDVDPLKKAS